MYWSGQQQRFLPQDIILLLPFLFVDNVKDKETKKKKKIKK